MAANNFIKYENDAEHEVYDDEFLGDNLEAEAGYLTYGDTESLIEYVEDDDEDEVLNENETAQKVNTHTLSVQQRNTRGGKQEVYRCLECEIDFATIEDFTKVHKVIQKKQHLTHRANAKERVVKVEPRIMNAEQESELLTNEPSILKQEEQNEEEMIVNEEEEYVAADVDEEILQEYNEMEEHIAECENIKNEIEDAIEAVITISNEVADEQTQSTQDAIDTYSNYEDNIDNDDYDGEKYFCCDCELIFNDLITAEQHICSALNNDESTQNSKTNEVIAEHIGIDSRELNDIVEQHKPKVEVTKIKTETTDLQYPCSECNRKFTTLQGLQIHSRSHKSQQQQKSKAAKNNAKIVEETYSTTCPECNTTFSSYKNLKLHMKIHNEQKLRPIEQALPAGAKQQYIDMDKFFCEICNKSFEQHLLGVHKNMHQQTSGYNCSVCNIHLESKISYDMHMQMHAEKPIPTYKSALDARAKQQGKKNKKEGGFPCQYCGSVFKRPYEKVRHERVHTGEKPHACEVCGKTFRVPYSLTLHLRMHTDIRPYVCATCNKRFKSQTVYAHHLRTHSTERPYKCEVCGKAFRTSVQLSGHRNIHSKPYSCPVCNRPFASLYYIKVHMKMHNKQKSTGDTAKYSCYICGAVYARIPALRIHMKDLHLVDMDSNEQLQLEADDNVDDDLIKGIQENYVAEDEEQVVHDNDDVLDEDEHEVDEEAAVLIAAAAEADCAAYIEAATGQSADDTTPSSSSSMGLHGMQYEVMLSNEELIVHNYQTEEVVTDWPAK